MKHRPNQKHNTQLLGCLLVKPGSNKKLNKCPNITSVTTTATTTTNTTLTTTTNNDTTVDGKNPAPVDR